MRLFGPQVRANVCVCLHLQKFCEYKGLLRCPLGSCDCEKAEHCVQQAAALRKSLLVLLQTGNCLPELCESLSKRRGDRKLGRFTGEGVGGTARKKQHASPAGEHVVDF